MQDRSHEQDLTSNNEYNKVFNVDEQRHYLSLSYEQEKPITVNSISLSKERRNKKKF